MKIISWDVGIKNLAYCVMEKQNDKDIPYKNRLNSTFKIKPLTLPIYLLL